MTKPNSPTVPLQVKLPLLLQIPQMYQRISKLRILLQTAHAIALATLSGLSSPVCILFDSGSQLSILC